MAWTSVVFPVPSSPDSPITAGARSARPNSSPNRLSSSSRHRMADRVPLGLELENLIAHHRRQLEVELLRRRLHLLLEQADEGLPLLRVGGAGQPGGRPLPRPPVRPPGGQAPLVDRLPHRAPPAARPPRVPLPPPSPPPPPPRGPPPRPPA